MGSAGSVPDVVALALPPTWPGAQRHRHDMAAGATLAVSGVYPSLKFGGCRASGSTEATTPDVHPPPVPEQDASTSEWDEAHPSDSVHDVGSPRTRTTARTRKRATADPLAMVVAPLDWVGSSCAWKETRLAVLDDEGMIGTMDRAKLDRALAFRAGRCLKAWRKTVLLLKIIMQVIATCKLQYT